MKQYVTRFFFITWPDDLAIHEIEEKFSRHWFDHVELCSRPDSILRSVFEVMDANPFIADKITISFAKEPVWALDSATGKTKRVAAKYSRQENKIAVCLKDFSLDVFQHECAHAVIENLYRANQRISLSVEEALAEWVDSKL